MKHLRAALLVAALVVVGSIFAVGSPAGAVEPEEHCALILPSTEIVHCWWTLERPGSSRWTTAPSARPRRGLRASASLSSAQ
jgi:hypothetical protein